jgi:indolepyruvate ferredoxin oxidoreductase alpha subunit
MGRAARGRDDDQVGLNVPPILQRAYTGVVGGFVIIPCDDPGPLSSQTEQDSRLLALTAKVPVFDPSTPAEALSMMRAAFDFSERHRVPVIVRPTTRLCHAVQSVELNGSTASLAPRPSAGFKKDPSLAATPAFR